MFLSEHMFGNTMFGSTVVACCYCCASFAINFEFEFGHSKISSFTIESEV
jgi:hypothetical protein